ncbi:hypothetical protein [Nocardioides coralli]|uniref:hypothetical protein n=1 Tax=Nocardioides coralli TaxID=2872154 RepID=UPI001CA3D381|nr:hypothetical protein [Nocardioides coralli]QZY30422.1 hypothetical protein K6T13_07140 [Nocardioides coralli]
MTSSSRARAGLVAGLVLVAAAVLVPRLLDWEVRARSARAGGISVPPLHGTWSPDLFGPGTVPAVLLALLALRYAGGLAARLRWSHLLLVSYAAGLVWLLALAHVNGMRGVSHVLEHPYDYLETAREVTDVGVLLGEFVPRIDADHPDNWTVHVAGHPPLALLFVVGLVRLGLGGYGGGVAIAAVAATTALAVMVAMRALDAEVAARRAAPFLVLGPAALFMAVSGDAVFAAVGAWGLAALAVAATRRDRGPALAWSVVAGLLLGATVMMSYGLVLLGPLALAVLAIARSWRPLPVAAAAATAVVLGFAAAGFAWWEGLLELRERYWRGLASQRPAAYWMWGNLAALVITAGPVLGAGLAQLRRSADRVVLWLVGAAATAVLLADVSQMSRAEVERIWLPFVPWLLVSTALLPERWRRPMLALQLATAVVLEHLLYTTW